MSSQIMGFALGALTASVAILVYTGMSTENPICRGESARSYGLQTNNACLDERPVRRLVPMAGDRTVVPTSDGMGIQISLSGSGGLAVLSSLAGSSIDGIEAVRRPDPPRGAPSVAQIAPQVHVAPEAGPEIAGSDQRGDRAPDTRSRLPRDSVRNIDTVPDIVPPARANSNDRPIFTEERAPDPVSTSPNQAWNSQVQPTDRTQITSREALVDPGPDRRPDRRSDRRSDRRPDPVSGPLDRSDGADRRGGTGVPSLLPNNEPASSDSGGLFGDRVATDAGFESTEPERREAPGSRFAFRRRVDIDRSDVAALPELAYDAQPNDDMQAEQAPPADGVAASPSAEADDSVATALEDLGDVRLRAGEHDGFSRLVVDWPRQVDYSLESGAGQARIVFPVAARIDADGARRQTLSRIRGFEVEQTGEGLVLTSDLAASMSVRAFRLDNRVVIDVQPS